MAHAHIGPSLVGPSTTPLVGRPNRVHLLAHLLVVVSRNESWLTWLTAYNA